MITPQLLIKSIFYKNCKSQTLTSHLSESRIIRIKWLHRLRKRHWNTMILLTPLQSPKKTVKSVNPCNPWFRQWTQKSFSQTLRNSHNYFSDQVSHKQTKQKSHNLGWWKLYEYSKYCSCESSVGHPWAHELHATEDHKGTKIAVVFFKHCCLLRLWAGWKETERGRQIVRRNAISF